MLSKGRQRNAKWYFKNEKEVMESLGLKSTPGSGNKWVHKEDGENDYIISQLKSTDKESFKLNLLDLQKLEYHALVANKTPLFILEFLSNGSKYAIINLEDIPKINQYLTLGKVENDLEIVLDNHEEIKPKVKKKIVSSKSAREKFYEEKRKEWESKKWKR